jgi:hypothetical protein
MFIVAWEGTPPPDKAEWTDILREVLAGELGSYRVVFRNTERGWRFELEWRDDGRTDGEVIANSPDSVSYNIYVTLAGSGKPLDAGWRPWDQGAPPSAPVTAAAKAETAAKVETSTKAEATAKAPVAARSGSSSRGGRRNRPASGRRTKPDR